MVLKIKTIGLFFLFLAWIHYTHNDSYAWKGCMGYVN